MKVIDNSDEINNLRTLFGKYAINALPTSSLTTRHKIPFQIRNMNDHADEFDYCPMIRAVFHIVDRFYVCQENVFDLCILLQSC